MSGSRPLGWISGHKEAVLLTESGGWMDIKDRLKSATVNSFKMAYKKHRGELQAAT